MLNYEDPYETWKSLGRPGGSFQAWQGGQALAPPPAPAPVVPTNQPGRPGEQRSNNGRGEYWNGTQWAPTPGQVYRDRRGQPVVPASVSSVPNAFNQAWMDEGLAAYNAGQRGSDPTRTPGFDPNTFRQTYAGLAGGNRPEDLARFSDATLAGWMPFYNPQTGKYRSMRGAEGWFDKPTECPPGTGPSGPNETDPCTPVGYGGQASPAASGAAPAAEVSNGGWAASVSPLASLMATQVATPESKPNANPFTVQPGYGTSGLAAALTPYQAPQTGQPRQDGLPGALMPWQNRKPENTGWFTGMRQ